MNAKENLTDANLLRYCSTWRYVIDVQRHFGVSYEAARKRIDKLVNSKQLTRKLADNRYKYADSECVKECGTCIHFETRQEISRCEFGNYVIPTTLAICRRHEPRMGVAE